KYSLRHSDPNGYGGLVGDQRRGCLETLGGAEKDEGLTRGCTKASVALRDRCTGKGTGPFVAELRERDERRAAHRDVTRACSRVEDAESTQVAELTQQPYDGDGHRGPRRSEEAWVTRRMGGERHHRRVLTTPSTTSGSVECLERAVAAGTRERQ